MLSHGFGGAKASFLYFQEFLTCQVFEYHPQPWNQWVIVGDLVVARQRHATTSIDPRHLRCASGVFWVLKDLMYYLPWNHVSGRATQFTLCVIQRLVISDGSDGTQNNPRYNENEWG